jgi:predicted permease
MTGFLQHLRYAVRQLRKSPGFTLMAILSLGLGIGANTAIFTLINSLLLKSLPVREPQRLIAFGKESGGGQIDGIAPGPLDIFTYQFYKNIEQRHPPFQGITAYSSFPTMVSVRTQSDGKGSASQISTHLVAGNFFGVLGAEPLLGRAITPADADAPGRNPVAVISYRYWQQALSGDSSVLGRSITINETPFTVIGVMPPKFFGVEVNEESPDMWLPLTMQREVMLQPSLLDPGSLYWLHMMCRLSPGTSMKQAQAWVTTQLQQYMADREGPQISVSRKQEIQKIYVELLPGGCGISYLRDQYSAPLNILMGAVVLVLLLACANLANFLLAKAASREREISTQLALGASRWRIVSQILTEALLLAFCGGVMGLLFAFWSTRALITFIVGQATHTPLAASPDLHVLTFTFLVAVVTGIMFGIVPALRVSRISVVPALSSTSRTSVGVGGRSGRLVPKVLVTAQVMVSILLLAGAGLLTRTLRNLENQNFGFDRHNILLVEFNAKFAGYKPEQLNALYERILGRLDALPGIRSATVSGGPPMSGNRWNSPIFIQGYTAKPNENLGTLLSRVGPGYFETVGVPLLRGRVIGAEDSASSPKVVVVNETMANYFFPKGDAIGHRFKVADPSVVGDWEIVGIVKGTKYNSPREEPQRMAYLPVMQLTGDDNYAYWLQVRTAQDPAQVAGEIRGALAEIDPNLPVLSVRTIIEQLDNSMSNERLISQLSSFFSLLALLLACIGLYGVMNYDVARRTNEIGVRMALGAQTSGVLWLVLKESLVLLGIGIAVGIPAALAATRLLQSQLFGLRPYDPVTFGTAVLIVCVVTLFAAYFPARRAAKVDPMVALRYE